MKQPFVFGVLLCLLASNRGAAQSFETEVLPLLSASCLGCHDADSETGLNLEMPGVKLSEADTFRMWERIYDRVRLGEMPPASEPRLDPKQRDAALAFLKEKLRGTIQLKRQQVGRVPARRLTRLELGYTLQDLLSIQGNLTSAVPDEVSSGSFDTVGATQRISAVHMESYLRAADTALDLAIQLGRNRHRVHEIDFINNEFLNRFHDLPLNQGGSVTRKAEDGVALFLDVDYLFRASIYGFSPRVAGTYQINSVVEAYQSEEPVTLKIIRRERGGGAELLGAFDLEPGQPETIQLTTFLKRGDDFYLTYHTGKTIEEGYRAVGAAGGAKRYKGPGLLIRGQTVEGPMVDSWPPKSVTELLHGLDLEGNENGPFRVAASKDKIDHVREIVQRLSPRVFRRPVSKEEVEPFVQLAIPAIEEGRPLLEVLRIPLRSMLSSPQFLLFSGEAGALDDYALASRLSYFLWKSLPDAELFELAGEGKLRQPDVLQGQVERLLEDGRSDRFVKDFLGQWLRLYAINATTPDEKLYPEYDELLAAALTQEPELFFSELLTENLSVSNLIDSDFTFLNRRLAEHYGIPGVDGQHFRKVALPAESPRGGVLTQAAVLKTTANGTVTSPVLRGNFVLTSILGTPPPPPPPSVGSIEPDIRGKTTIREILAAHRDIETCNQCHREIDPPGFALESFDPIGGYRERYRSTGGGLFGLLTMKEYHSGPRVDASGVTSSGKKFSGIKEFKQLLLNDKEEVARNLVSQLVIYSTGGQIEFADRDAIDAILDQTRENEFQLRDIVHAVVQSPLFLHK